MPSCDVNAATRLAEASWSRDNTGCFIIYDTITKSYNFYLQQIIFIYVLNCS